jgi:PAS domain S-box-containing protein
MLQGHPTRHQLQLEIQQLQARLDEAEETLRAIRSGEVDAVVVSGPQGDQVFTLRGAEQPYRILVETMNEGTVTLLPDGTMVYSNSRFSETVRMPLEQVIGSSFVRFLPSPQKPLFELLLERSRKGGGKEEFTLQAGDGSLVPVQLSVRPLENTPTDGFCLVITDLTEQKRAERERLLAAIVECSEDAIIGKRLDGTIVSWNRGAERLYGYQAQEVVGRSIALLLPSDHPDELPAILERINRGEMVEHYESERMRKDGTRVYVSLSVSPLRDATGTIVGASAIARDITERKRAEEAIRTSLQQKELLLKEIHHRVKNNLQVISSLLSLQSELVKDKEVLGVLRESQSRVRSLALIHQKLYSSGDLAKVDFARYVESFVAELFRMYDVNPRRIASKLDLDNVSLDIDTAMPCGLIVNELVVNCLKHAFKVGPKDDGQGEISVGLHPWEHGGFTLTVRDNGVGLPKGLDTRRTQSLGLQLVDGLTAQLRGTIEHSSGPGTEFKLTVPG